MRRYRKRGTPPPPCVAEGCERDAIRRWLCTKHYSRWLRNGDLDLRQGEQGEGYITGDGYRRLTIGGHRILEHRLVAEQELGRPLREDEDVHHVNGDKLDNRPENLIVLSHSDHTKLHWDEGKQHPKRTA